MRLSRTQLVTVACLLLSVGCAHTVHERAPGHSPRISGGGSLSWPLRGKLSSGFGSERGSHHHRGIDLRVAPGTPIRAAAPGRVSFSGRMRGYGYVVMLDHGRGLETRYAHNRANLVRKGDQVARGAVIAEVGSSGNASAPHLHFEVREGGRARDPLRFLGPTSLSADQ